MRTSTNGMKCALALLLAAGAVAQKPTPGPTSGTAVVTPQATLNQQVRVATGRLSGRTLTTAGRQPIGFHTLTLCDSKGTEVDKLVTDGNGVYRTRPLEPGNYSLYVRKDLKLDLVVADDAETHVLDIVVPPRGSTGPTAPVADPARIPAVPGGAGPAIPGSVAAAAAPPPPNPVVGMGLGTWALIGAGAATVVAVPVVASSGGGGSEGVVSSTGAHLHR